MKNWLTDGSILKLEMLTISCPYCGHENYVENDLEDNRKWDRIKYCAHCGERASKPMDVKKKGEMAAVEAIEKAGLIK